MKITPLRLLFVTVFVASGIIFGIAIWSPSNTWVEAQKFGMTGLDVFLIGIFCALAVSD